MWSLYRDSVADPGWVGTSHWSDVISRAPPCVFSGPETLVQDHSLGVSHDLRGHSLLGALHTLAGFPASDLAMCPFGCQAQRQPLSWTSLGIVSILSSLLQLF